MNENHKNQNTVLRSMDSSGTFRVFLGDMTKMVEELRQINDSTPTATAVLGRTAVAASLMGMMQQDDSDRLTLVIDGGGPAGKITAVATGSGNVKAYMVNPTVDLPLNDSGKLDVGGAVGTDGTLSVVRDMGMGDPYVGQCPLVSGEIAEDVTKYFSVSEQQSTAVALGVLVDVDYTVKEAGGLIVQVLPDPAEDVLRQLESNIKRLTSLTGLMEESRDIYEVQKKIFNGIPMKVEASSHPELKCDCSRERMERALISIGRKDLQEIVDEDGEAELVCHFCRTHYNFNKEQLEALLAQI